MSELIKGVANQEVQGTPSEHERHFEKVVRPENALPDRTIPPTVNVSSVGGNMDSQAGLHKTFIRQGPSHHYNGGGEDGGKQYKL